jgi:hypothetical protein
LQRCASDTQEIREFGSIHLLTPLQSGITLWLSSPPTDAALRRSAPSVPLPVSQATAPGDGLNQGQIDPA